MEPTQAQRPAPNLIPPRRQLKAALHKSAERAQRLADAFGKTVPSVEPTQKTPPKPARAAKQAS